MILLEKEVASKNLIKFVYTTIGKGGSSGEESVLIDINKIKSGDSYQIDIKFPKDENKNLIISDLSYQQINIIKLMAYLDSISEVIKIIYNPLTYFTDIDSANDFLNLDFGRLLLDTNKFFGTVLGNINYIGHLEECNYCLNVDSIDIVFNNGKHKNLTHIDNLSDNIIIELKNEYFYLKLTNMYNELVYLLKVLNIEPNIDNFDFFDLIEWFRERYRQI